MDLTELNNICLTSTYLPRKKFSELIDKKIYHVTQIRKVKSDYGINGKSIVVELNDEFQSYLPNSKSDVIVQNNQIFNELEDAVEKSRLYLHYKSNGQF